MYECPHCGEPFPEGAQACPYCGSDFETGWNPDADYLSIELPEEEDFSLEAEDQGIGGRRAGGDQVTSEDFAGILSIVVAGLLFLSVTFRLESGRATLAAAVLLGACAWFFYHSLRRRRR